jgi:2',3'-cyclic-nucleotide 2'-phosphodiesterase (5'-nucleotidase family)
MRLAPPGGDVAITNGGGLRADLPKGPLTYGSLFEALPFDNTFATLTITGAQLAALMGNNLGREGGILSISGVRALARCVDRSLVVTLTRENGRRVKPSERLTLVTSNFLATGGDEVLQEISGTARFDDTRIIRDEVADQLRARKTPLDPAQLYDPRRPRLTYPGPRPVKCSSPKAK